MNRRVGSTRKWILALAFSVAAGATALWAEGPGGDAPWLSMSAPRMLPHAGQDAQGTEPESAGALKPRSLASGEFNNDGASDLLAGYAAARGGLVTFQAGDPTGLGPQAVTARNGWPAGKLPFKDSISQIQTEELPDWILVGDFDADSRPDFAVAAHGGHRIEVHLGDGLGGFGPPMFVELPGDLTALVCGDVNRPVGLADWVAGVMTVTGPALMVFESPGGAFKAEPERFDFDAPISAIAIGRISGAPFPDIVAAVGSDLAIIKGRDRMLSQSQEVRASVPAASIAFQALPVSSVDLAIGDFIWDQDHRPELAALGADGRIRILSPARAESPNAFETSSSGSWPIQPDIVLPEKASRLHVVRSTSLPVDGLIVLPEATGTPVRFIAGDVEERTDGLTQIHRPPRSKTLRPQAVGCGLSVAAVLPMQLNTDVLQDWVFFGTDVNGAPVISAMTTQSGATFVVTNASDSGAGSLRQAIINANIILISSTINFQIPGTGIPTIYLLSPLPKITSVVNIQGGTQSAGYVAIDGTLAGTSSNGLDVAGGNSAVWSLVVKNFGNHGILLETNGSDTVNGCRIGTNTAGTAAAGNGHDGIIVGSTSPEDTIGSTTYPNLISGNDVNGIAVGASDTTVLGNRIGTNLAGTAAIANGEYGVDIYNGTSTVIGGTASSARNVISGNLSGGVKEEGGMLTLIEGNWIGPNLAGSDSISGGGTGVYLASDASPTVGGTSRGAGNVINTCTNGVYVTGTGGAYIQGNIIGLDTSGNQSKPNIQHGVKLANASTTVYIGGGVSGAGNVISGNQWNGIRVQNNSTAVISSNLIGLDATGAAARANNEGIYLDGAYSVIIGGTTALDRNVISGNGGSGIDALSTSLTISIIGNYIGTNKAGTVAVPNTSYGINSGASGVHVGGAVSGAGNVISGNGAAGVVLTGTPSTVPVVQGNLIGLNATGTAALGNQGDGIDLVDVYSTTIGGSSSAARNVISGNANAGILIKGDSSQNVISGNYIGTNAAGSSSLGNKYGVSVDMSSGGSLLTGYNMIGGTSASQANLISGNSSAQVEIVGDGVHGNNSVLGNSIGTNLAGNAGLGGLDGVYVSNSFNDSIGSAGSGNLISGNGGSGIIVYSGTGTTIQGNKIGLDAQGTMAIPNGTGVTLGGSSTNSTTNILLGGTAGGQGNVISGNSLDGVWAEGLTSSQIQGNVIGLDPSGLKAIANGESGIELRSGTSNVTVGGTSSSARNVISANGQSGILIQGGGNNNTIQGNYVGLTASGALSAGNSGSGITLRGSTNTVGGTAAGAGNFVGSNQGNGLTIDATSGGGTGNVVQGNTFGLLADGQHTAPNTGSGILISGSNNIIGGSTAMAGNVISANGLSGILIASNLTSGNSVLGNKIGTDATGTIALGNNGAGVELGSSSFASGNTIGQPLGRNVIANNSGPGVWIHQGTGNSIRANSLYNNGGGSAANLGIVLGTGLVANDSCDSDNGPNNLQNFPVITSVTPSGSGSLVSGTLNSKSVTTFTVDVYSNMAVHSSGYGEGKTWLGSVSVTTNFVCAASWSLTTSIPVTNVSATATDPNGNTSEFSLTFVTGIPTEAGPAALPLKATKGSGTAVDITYGAACNATEYAVYWGTSPIAGSLSWQSSVCNAANSFDPGAVAPGSFVYFVVAGEGDSYEGSYGKNSLGVERAAMPGGCHPQDLGGSCP